MKKRTSVNVGKTKEITTVNGAKVKKQQVLSRKRQGFPIIHIIGLPGAGKTILAERLSRKLSLSVYRIGQYRSRCPVTVLGEADAWVRLFADLSKRRWGNCILETTGLNSREGFLKTAIPLSRVIKIKLEAKKKTLYERIRKKKRSEQGGEWLYSEDYRDKFEFVRKMYKGFKDIPAIVRIDTSNLTPRKVYKTAMQEIDKYTLLFYTL